MGGRYTRMARIKKRITGVAMTTPDILRMFFVKAALSIFKVQSNYFFCKNRAKRYRLFYGFLLLYGKGGSMSDAYFVLLLVDGKYIQTGECGCRLWEETG